MQQVRREELLQQMINKDLEMSYKVQRLKKGEDKGFRTVVFIDEETDKQFTKRVRYSKDKKEFKKTLEDHERSFKHRINLGII